MVSDGEQVAHTGNEGHKLFVTPLVLLDVIVQDPEECVELFTVVPAVQSMLFVVPQLLLIMC